MPQGREMTWDEYRTWFRQANGTDPRPEDYDLYLRYERGEIRPIRPTTPVGPTIPDPAMPGNSVFNNPQLQRNAGPSFQFRSGPDGNPFAGGGGGGGGLDLGAIWDWVKQHAGDLLKAGLIGVGIYNAIKGSQAAGRSEDYAAQAADIAKQDYESRGPLRERALQLLDNFALPIGLASLGGTGGRIPSLAGAFSDPGNPYNMIPRLAALRPPGAAVPPGQIVSTDPGTHHVPLPPLRNPAPPPVLTGGPTMIHDPMPATDPNAIRRTPDSIYDPSHEIIAATRPRRIVLR